MPEVTRSRRSMSTPVSMSIEPGIGEQRAHRGALVAAVFDEQCTAGFEVRGRSAHDVADRIEPVVARGQRRRRLVTQRIQVQIAERDVRRVARDRVEQLVAQRFAPVAVAELDIGQAQRACVGLRDFERGGAVVDGDDLRARTFVGDRQRDRAAARAEIGDADGVFAREMREREFDEEFGFRARNERIGRDLEFETPEALATGEIGERFAGDAAREQRGVTLRGIVGDGIVAACVQPAARLAEHEGEKPFGVGVFDLRARVLQQVVDANGGRVGHGAHRNHDAPPAARAFDYFFAFSVTKASGMPLRADFCAEHRRMRFRRLLELQRAAFDRSSCDRRSATRHRAASDSLHMPAEYRPTSAAPAGARRASSSLKCASTHWRSAGRSLLVVGLAADDREDLVAAEQALLEHQRARAFGQRRVLGRPPIAPSSWMRITASWLARKCFSAASNAALPPSCTATSSATRAQILRHRVGVQLAIAVQAEHRAALLAHFGAHRRVLQRVGEEVRPATLRSRRSSSRLAVLRRQAERGQARAIDLGGLRAERGALGFTR